MVLSGDPEAIDNYNTIGIVEIKNDSLTLETFFTKDILNALTNQNEIKIADFGKAKIAGMHSYWLSFNSKTDNLKQQSYLYYLKNNKKNNNFYLLNTTVKGN
ncbi:hypothetical protein F0365_15580 [Nonlabens sp. Ci31]|uniref:hypothetical protein n=1 Tax=Nonlabens sp. Ci31 TaxID=2608253 RepID=UPI0014646DE4|nr:hypothetical protein [Nonlabens sp. Ci31]QJP35721.1 hypothetical protein F0365_15580 [Nonlabens sp. Ci31]